MPDYGFNTQLTPNIPQTNISDMINLARGVQGYQQSQQMNPLELQAKQQQILQARQAYEQAQLMNPETLAAQRAATQLAQGTLAPKIAQAGSEAGTAAANEKVATATAPYKIATSEEESKQAKTNALKAALGLTTDQRNIFLKTAGGFATDSRLDPENLAKNPGHAIDVANEMADELDNTGLDRKQVRMLSATALTTAQRDPGRLGFYLQTLAKTSMPPSEQVGLGLPAEAQPLAGQPMVRNKITGALTPAPINQPTQPAPVNLPGGVSSAMMGKPATDQPSAMRFPPPNVLHAETPQETAERTVGTEYVGRLSNAAVNLPEIKRTLEDILKSSENLKDSGVFWQTGPGGAINRKWSELTGDPQYKELSKNIARSQMELIKARGGSGALDSVAGISLQDAASGNATFPPQALIDIAHRNFADMKDIELQGQASNKFVKKFGEANIKSFQTDWAKNSDNKVFQAMAINEQVQDKDKKKELINNLLGPDPEQRKMFFKKYQNIQKLVNDGTLQ